MKVSKFPSLDIISEIIHIHNTVWDNSPGIIDLLKNSTDCYVLVDDEDMVLGYAFVQEDKKRGFVELQDIAIQPKHRGKGCGKILMDRIMADYSQIKLIARAKQRKLIAFYQSFGFIKESMIENYYDIGIDGQRMSWKRPIDLK